MHGRMPKNDLALRRQISSNQALFEGVEQLQGLHDAAEKNMWCRATLQVRQISGVFIIDFARN